MSSSATVHEPSSSSGLLCHSLPFPPSLLYKSKNVIRCPASHDPLPSSLREQPPSPAARIGWGFSQVICCQELGLSFFFC